MHIEVHRHCKCVMSTLRSSLFYTPTLSFVVHFVVNTIFLVQYLCSLKKCSMMLIMKFLHNRNSHIKNSHQMPSTIELGGPINNCPLTNKKIDEFLARLDSINPHDQFETSYNIKVEKDYICHQFKWQDLI